MHYRPQLLQSFAGYNFRLFTQDILAGITVGVVALPLAMAFAIASGLKPELGIYTAIIGGGLISLFGGSRVQIGGPAGAFIVIVYGIVDRYGIANLLIATFMSGIFLFAMGFFRLGTLVRFIPIAVIVGFTNGIALLIALSQINNFFGLTIEKMPAQFFGMMSAIFSALNTFNPITLSVSVASLGLLIAWRFLHHHFGWFRHLPGPVVVMVSATWAVSFFNLSTATIGSRFGGIPASLPQFDLIAVNWDSAQLMIAPAITLALLGAIESLLCARVADGLIHQRHDSNQELMAQGMANCVVPFFGGMPATGTIARTVTNIQSGGTTPLAGLIHALTLLLIILFAAPLAQNIPLGCLAAILMYVAWNMGEWRKLIYLKQFRLPYRITLLSVFILTVVVDLTVALEVGLLCALLTFVYRVSNLSRSEAVNLEEHPELKPLTGEVAAYRMYGALFFGAVKLIERLETKLPKKILILDLKNIIYIDSSGMDALLELYRHCQQAGVHFILCGLNNQPHDIAQRMDLFKLMPAEYFYPDLAQGIHFALSKTKATF
ncbi:STAS domain-containing protein [Polynucleobacter sp. IMCC30063]|uniref:SulP family inorganic anion transporter n=1 Tax=unclassified Polynucleobacter TaxID=2640945 RepID=UPI001EEB2B93|nr:MULTISPECIES: SulP family inorganic anion transporter [unclassified Polynucleobacter]MCE7506295.1 STAS domain-containing protein [Polynucleobacter sp. IMCC30063]MCE7527575.1 STAS domain-containing protein [Polynucleobacter sp. IMCC 30228]MCE7529393.1 STAS domain-containing protein [Polynucleobacter sp. IMCC 29146]